MQTQDDDRIQAIRCMGCHRLRPHPRGNVDAASVITDSARVCICGDIRIMKTFPLEDEEQLALKLYAREIEEYLCRNPSALR